jgi:hypothetical protein
MAPHPSVPGATGRLALCSGSPNKWQGRPIRVNRYLTCEALVWDEQTASLA